jgi:hypothetical protein
MKITTNRIKQIIREELNRVNEALSKEAAEDAASMYNSDHWGLDHRQLVRMIMQHGHIDAAYPEYLEFRDGHEHNRGDYVEDSEDVDYDIDRRRMNKPMMEEEG